MALLRLAQYGTKHGHAAGKLAALRHNPRVEFAGVFETFFKNISGLGFWHGAFDMDNLTFPPFRVIVMVVMAIMPWRNRMAQARNLWGQRWQRMTGLSFGTATTGR